MKDAYPTYVIDKILQITLETENLGYFALDDEGFLQAHGGNLASMGMGSWNIGDAVLPEVLFLTGYVPADADYELSPTVQVSDDLIVDVHIFRDGLLNWVILVDRTDQLVWESRARQSGNELSLLKQKLATFNPETSFDFFKTLNMLALRKLDDDRFQLLRPISENFRTIYPESFEQHEYLTPQGRFPFLENFLIDAHQLWDSGQPGRIYSGPWIELTSEGEEVALEATAVEAEGHHLLFMQILDEHYEQHHEFLQIGREGLLLKSYLQEEVHKRTEAIRDREEEIALRLVAAADTRDDGETGAHIRRIGLYSELMAKNLNWPTEKIHEIRIAAPMHDVGKIGIPDSILRKPGKLDAAEFEIMKTHAAIGARILSNSDSPLVEMAREIALGHHEKWDGSGYPKGLSGEDIPASARIVAIVDVFDALIHKRIYKDGMSIEEALEIMRESRGTHFDPNLFDLFYDLRDEMAEIAADDSDPLKNELDEIDEINY